MKSKNGGDSFIFGRDIRFLIKFLTLFLSLLSCCLSVLFLLSSVQQNWGIGIFAAFLFVFPCVYLLLGGKTIKVLVAAKYQLAEQEANNIGKYNTHVSTTEPLYICILPTRFHAKGAHFQLPVYLIANKPITYLRNYETYSVGLAKQAMALGIVVLPVNEETTQWVQQRINVIPPEYPKVAYFQK